MHTEISVTISYSDMYIESSTKTLENLQQPWTQDTRPFYFPSVSWVIMDP